MPVPTHWPAKLPTRTGPLGSDSTPCTSNRALWRGVPLPRGKAEGPGRGHAFLRHLGPSRLSGVVAVGEAGGGVDPLTECSFVFQASVLRLWWEEVSGRGGGSGGSCDSQMSPPLVLSRSAVPQALVNEAENVRSGDAGSRELEAQSVGEPHRDPRPLLRAELYPTWHLFSDLLG